MRRTVGAHVSGVARVVTRLSHALRKLCAMEPALCPSTAGALDVPFTGLLALAEPEASQALAAVLRQAGFQVMNAASLAHAQRIAGQVMPDFVVCDLELSDEAAGWVQGLMAGELSDERSPRVKVAVGLVNSQTPDGNTNANDDLQLMRKPVLPAVLMARITEALYIDSNCAAADASAEGYAVLRGLDAVVSQAPDLMLFAPTERKLFIALAQVAPRVLRREHIRESVWPGEQVSARVVDQYVKRLRSRLRQLASPLCVTTVRGHGYRLDLPRRTVINSSSAVPTVRAEATSQWR